MNRKYLNRIIEVAVLSLAIAAVCQELEKPREEREWHGKIAGFVPYDFRLPTREKFKESYWNPANGRIFTPEVFGIGWAINFFALLEKLRVIRESYLSEADFLMPSQFMRELLSPPPERE